MSSELVKRDEDKIRLSTGGVLRSIEKIADAIKEFGKKYNLVSPGGAIGQAMPALYAVGISFVVVAGENETYPIAGGNKRGLGKTVLDRIAAAAGVRWDNAFCGRVDQGDSPYFVEYQAVGTVLQLDGTERTIQAVKRIDLRGGKGTDPDFRKYPVDSWGTDAQEIARIALAKKDRDGKPEPRDPWPQIVQARQHILSLAESKAKNRAIRSLGIRSSYDQAEIDKGFAIVKLQFTGHSEDPTVSREIEMMIAKRALGGAALLYGAGSERPALGSPNRVVSRIAAAVAEADDDDDIIDVSTPPADEDDEKDAPPIDAPDPEPPTKPTSNGKAKAPASRPILPKENPLLICGKQSDDGSWPKKRASEFGAKDLEAKIAYAEKKRPEWDPRWATKNQRELDAMKAWLEVAKAAEAAGPDDAGDADEDRP